MEATGTEAPADDYSDETATFGDRLVLAREAVGMTQEDLAHRLGIKLATLKTWEEDRAEPRSNKLQMLAGMLNVSMGWMMSGRGPAPMEAAGDVADPVQACLASLRDLRADQMRLVEKMARLEKRLRAAL